MFLVHSMLTWLWLLVFERDAETGRLTGVGTPRALNDVEALAISDDDRYLFAVSDDGRTQIFGLEDPSSPQHLDSLPHFGNIPSWRYWNCDFAAVRNGNPAIDALCHDLAFSAEWRPETAELLGTDVVAGTDRFNNEVPTFNNCCDVSPAASPDGKHIYARGLDPSSSIDFFERVGNELVDVTEPTEMVAPDLVCPPPASDSGPDACAGGSPRRIKQRSTP